MIPINPLDLTIEPNITVTAIELIQIKQSVVNQTIGLVVIGLYIAFVIGMIFGYQFHKYKMKKDEEKENGTP